MNDKFARFYYDKFMAEFPDVYAEDAPFATWIRLLVLAEKMWPTRPELPRSVKKSALTRLVEKRLVKVDGLTYSIRGLDAERNRRQDAARNAAAKRWQSDSNADSLHSAMPRRVQNEKNTGRDEDRPDLEAFLLVRRKGPSAKQRQVLDEIFARHDVAGAQWAADLILGNPDDPIGAVLEADKKWREEQIEAARRAERKPPAPRRRPGLPTSVRDVLQEWAETNAPSGQEPAA